jgi:hypothetical protein
MRDLQRPHAVAALDQGSLCAKKRQIAHFASHASYVTSQDRDLLPLDLEIRARGPQLVALRTQQIAEALRRSACFRRHDKPKPDAAMKAISKHGCGQAVISGSTKALPPATSIARS